MSTSNQTSFSNLMVTVATLIFAITSMITVFISLSAWKEEREAVRPYLTISNSQVTCSYNELIFCFDLCNVGVNPAAALNCQTIFLDFYLNSPPLHKDQYSLGNYITRNTIETQTIKINSNKAISKDVTGYYIVINLKYSDPVLGENHEQIIYLRWPGIINGKSAPIFHASKEEKDFILKCLQKY